MNSNYLPKNISLGRALWGIHALWVTVLEDWLAHNDEQPGIYKPWRGIEFDKLAHFLHLAWNALYEHKPKLVSFPSTYDSNHGVHGPGPALPRRNNPDRYIPVLDVLHHIQDRLKLGPDLFLFELDIRKHAGKKQYFILPGRTRAYAPFHLSETLLPAWTPNDIEKVNMLKDLVRDFSQEEIRTIGTHQTKQGTLHGIEYNIYIHLFHRLINESEYLENPSDKKRRRKYFGETDLPSLAYVIDEIERKCRSNEKPYKSAWDKLSRKAKNGNHIAQILTSRVFSKPSEIWVDDVTYWFEIWKKMIDLHSYFIALRNIYFPPKEPSTNEKQIKLEKQLNDQRHKCLQGIDSIKRYFNIELIELPDSHISYPWSQLRAQIVDIFDRLPYTPGGFRNEYKAKSHRYRI